jgi:hypothetical protein
MNENSELSSDTVYKRINGYKEDTGLNTDWYLPSVMECRDINKHLNSINALLEIIGGKKILTSTHYWTSSQPYANNNVGTFPVSYKFKEDWIYTADKTLQYNVRLVYTDYSPVIYTFGSNTRRAQMPAHFINKGQGFFNESTGKMDWWNGSQWVDANGNFSYANKGIFASRPSINYLSQKDAGMRYWNTETNKPVFFKIVNTGTEENPVYVKSWIDIDGAEANIRRSGAKSQRPVGSSIYVGFQYMQVDTTYGTYPIWASVINGDTVTWVDATGTSV